MWNMSESDKRYYDRLAAHEEKRKRALKKAKARGEAAKKWFDAGNKLTPETKREFDALMKKVIKEN